MVNTFCCSLKKPKKPLCWIFFFTFDNKILFSSYFSIIINVFQYLWEMKGLINLWTKLTDTTYNQIKLAFGFKCICRCIHQPQLKLHSDSLCLYTLSPDMVIQNISTHLSHNRHKDCMPDLSCQSTSDLHPFHFVKYLASEPTGSFQQTPTGPFGVLWPLPWIENWLIVHRAGFIFV